MQVDLIARNPYLVEFIEMQVGKHPRELHQSMFEVIVGTLVVLDRQMGADDLQAGFTDEPR